MGSSAGAASGSSNGGVPPGFRFHPTDEELLHFYLKKKVSYQKFDMEVIREVDLNKIEPWELQERCKIGSTPQNEWYFFSHKDRKYPTGSRTNRATSAGFWKATGRDKCIRNSFKKIGMRKTLVFYRGRAPHGQKTDWIMHEYRLEDSDDDPQATHEDGWVVCRVFKKKNLFKVGNSTSNEGRHHSGGIMLGTYSDQLMNVMSDSTTSCNLQYSQSGAVISSYAQRSSDQINNLQVQEYFLQQPEIHHGSTRAHEEYPHEELDEAQNFMSTHRINKPLMVLNNNYHQDQWIHNPVMIPTSSNTMHVKELMMSSSACASDHDCEDHQSTSKSINAGLGLSRPDANCTSINQINQLSLRGNEMDFWAYNGK